MSPADREAGREPTGPNRYSSLRLIIGLGVVSMLADFVHEGCRSVVGPYLATLGASAALVGAVTGVGEAVASVFRLASGPIADRTRRYWPIAILGHVITVISMPGHRRRPDRDRRAVRVLPLPLFPTGIVIR